MIYKTPGEMQAVIDQYFDDCLYNRRCAADSDAYEKNRTTVTDDCHPTISGLAVTLGMSRMALLNYESREEFIDTVKKAKSRVEAYVEQRLFYGQPVGCIFNLKNNFGWKDKTEQELSGSLDLQNLTDEQLNARIRELMS